MPLGLQMQAIAAEFNLAETTFVRPPQDAAHTAEVRAVTATFIGERWVPVMSGTIDLD